MNRSLRGFTLVEVLIGLSFFSICVVVCMSITAKSRHAFDDSWLKTIASYKAQELMATIKMARWDQLGGAGQVPTANATIGPDANLYNDIDDWDGFADSSDQFERQVSVKFVTLMNVGGQWKVVEVSGPTDTKQVTVHVYTKAGVEKTVRHLFTNVSEQVP